MNDANTDLIAINLLKQLDGLPICTALAILERVAPAILKNTHDVKTVDNEKLRIYEEALRQQAAQSS